MDPSSPRPESPDTEKALSHSDDGSPDPADFPTKIEWADDPDNPQNWKFSKRCFHTFVPSKPAQFEPCRETCHADALQLR